MERGKPGQIAQDHSVRFGRGLLFADLGPRQSCLMRWDVCSSGAARQQHMWQSDIPELGGRRQPASLIAPLALERDIQELLADLSDRLCPAIRIKSSLRFH